MCLNLNISNHHGKNYFWHLSFRVHKSQHKKVLKIFASFGNILISFWPSYWLSMSCLISLNSKWSCQKHFIFCKLLRKEYVCCFFCCDLFFVYTTNHIVFGTTNCNWNDIVLFQCKVTQCNTDKNRGAIKKVGVFEATIFFYI
jgi:hypothetical protein